MATMDCEFDEDIVVVVGKLIVYSDHQHDIFGIMIKLLVQVSHSQ